MKAYFLETQFLSDVTIPIYKKAFEAKGVEIEFKNWTKWEEVIDGAKDADCVFSMAIPMRREVIEALPNLKFIGRCGVGYDSVDLNAATEHGVVTCNVPDYCVHEVASQAFMLTMVLERQLMGFMDRARKGGFGPGHDYPVYRLKGQTMGLVGFGRIARALARMAQGMDMKVVSYDPYISESGDPGVEMVGLDTLLETADVVAMCVPLSDETFHMISMPQLKKMKKTAYLVNTSRGGLVNTEDLVQALKEGVIAGAGLDVFETEPLPVDHAFFSMPNVIVTPHTALYSEEALVDMHARLAEQALDVLGGHKTRNIVNTEVLEKLSLKD